MTHCDCSILNADLKIFELIFEALFVPWNNTVRLNWLIFRTKQISFAVRSDIFFPRLLRLYRRKGKKKSASLHHVQFSCFSSNWFSSNILLSFLVPVLRTFDCSLVGNYDLRYSNWAGDRHMNRLFCLISGTSGSLSLVTTSNSLKSLDNFDL